MARHIGVNTISHFPSPKYGDDLLKATLSGVYTIFSYVCRYLCMYVDFNYSTLKYLTIVLPMPN